MQTNKCEKHTEQQFWATKHFLLKHNYRLSRLIIVITITITNCAQTDKKKVHAKMWPAHSITWSHMHSNSWRTFFFCRVVLQMGTATVYRVSCKTKLDKFDVCVLRQGIRNRMLHGVCCDCVQPMKTKTMAFRITNFSSLVYFSLLFFSVFPIRMQRIPTEEPLHGASHVCACAVSSNL